MVLFFFYSRHSSLEQGSVYVHRFKTKKHTQDYTQKGTTKSFAKGKLGTMKQKTMFEVLKDQ